MSRFVGPSPSPSFLPGTGTPAASLGKDGDSYVDLATGAIWQRAAGAWTNTGTALHGAISDAAFMAWFNGLPMTPPAAPGVPWNNGNTVAVSS